MGEHDARSDAVDPDPERTSSFAAQATSVSSAASNDVVGRITVLAQRLHAGDGHRITAAAVHGVAGVLTVRSL
jgi:hypothetical protein